MTRLPIDTMTARAAFVSRVLANAPTTEGDPDEPLRRWLSGDKSVGDFQEAQAQVAARHAARAAREAKEAAQEQVRLAAQSAREGMKELRDRLAAGGIAR